MRSLIAVKASLRFIIFRFANAHLGGLDEISQLVAAVSIRDFVKHNYWHPLTFREVLRNTPTSIWPPRLLRLGADAPP